QPRTGTKRQISVRRWRDCLPAFGEKMFGVRIELSHVVRHELTEDDYRSAAKLKWAQFHRLRADTLRIAGCRQDPHTLLDDAIQARQQVELAYTGNITVQCPLKLVEQLRRHLRMLSQ